MTVFACGERIAIVAKRNRSFSVFILRFSVISVCFPSENLL
jgi:hypothetical protein